MKSEGAGPVGELPEAPPITPPRGSGGACGTRLCHLAASSEACMGFSDAGSDVVLKYGGVVLGALGDA